MYIVKFNCYSIRKLQHKISIYNKVKVITDVKVVKNVNATKASSEDIYQYNQIQKVLVLQKNKIIQKKKMNKQNFPPSNLLSYRLGLGIILPEKIMVSIFICGGSAIFPHIKGWKCYKTLVKHYGDCDQLTVECPPLQHCLLEKSRGCNNQCKLLAYNRQHWKLK